MTLDQDDIRAIARQVAQELRAQFGLPDPLADATELSPLRVAQIRAEARADMAALDRFRAEHPGERKPRAARGR